MSKGRRRLGATISVYSAQHSIGGIIQSGVVAAALQIPSAISPRRGVHENYDDGGLTLRASFSCPRNIARRGPTEMESSTADFAQSPSRARLTRGSNCRLNVVVLYVKLS